jgi:hypothetical protein
MGERVWTGLAAAAADGLACVVCGRSFQRRWAPARRPVGRSHTGSQVFACVGDCAQRAAAPPEVLVIPVEALTAGGVALLAVVEGAGGDVHRADPDDLVSETVRAAAPLVVAAELRRMAGQVEQGYWWVLALRARADELDPAGGES